jgi:hypothetical protein
VVLTGVAMVEVNIDGRTIIVRGRAAAMIQYLSAEAERINDPERLRLEFNCSGFRQVRAKLDVFSEDAFPIE